MKNHLILYLIHVIIGYVLSSCQGIDIDHEIPLEVIDEQSSLNIAKKSLKFLQKNEMDSLSSLFNDDVIKRIKPEQVNLLKETSKKVFNEYKYPNDTSILISQSTNYSLKGKKVIYTFSIPFQYKSYEDSIKYFHITVANNEIYRLFLNEYPPGIRIIEPKKTEPHLSKINLQVNNLNWFRIWYRQGIEMEIKNGNSDCCSAVSGNKNTFDNLGMKATFEDVFKFINTAQIDSLDFNYLRDEKIGDPEWIYLRFKFDNEEYKDLGEFLISCFIKEETGKKEVMSDYIIFKHTEKTRYLLLKSKHPELVEKLTEIAHYDYGQFYE